MVSVVVMGVAVAMMCRDGCGDMGMMDDGCGGWV